MFYEAALESEGIDYLLKAPGLVAEYPLAGGPMSEFMIYVRKSDAERAQEIIERLQLPEELATAHESEETPGSGIDDPSSPSAAQGDLGFPACPWNGWDLLKGSLLGWVLLIFFVIYYDSAGWVREASFATSGVVWTVGFFLSFLAPIWLLTIFRKGSISDLPSQRVGGGVLLFTALGALLWTVVDSAVWSLVSSVIDVPTSQQYWWGTNEPFDAGDLPALVFSVVIIVPVAEELLFRGFLLRYFGSFLRPGLAITLVATLFALYHFQPPGIPNRLLGGLVAGGLVYLSKSLYPAIIFHMTINAYAVLGVTKTL